MDGWVAGLSYFNLKVNNSIEYTSAQDQLNVDFQTGGNNPAVQRNSLGQVIEIAAGFQNGAAEFEYNGLDYVVRGTVRDRLWRL